MAHSLTASALFDEPPIADLTFSLNVQAVAVIRRYSPLFAVIQ
jgi:hypothetical protein